MFIYLFYSLLTKMCFLLIILALNLKEFVVFCFVFNIHLSWIIIKKITVYFCICDKIWCVFLMSLHHFFCIALKLCDNCCDCQRVYTISLQLLKYKLCLCVCPLFVILHIFYTQYNPRLYAHLVIISSWPSYHIPPLCNMQCHYILFHLVNFLCLFISLFPRHEGNISATIGQKSLE